MKIIKILCAILAIIVLAVFVSCERPPEDEMIKAREAVFRAENDPNAVIYGASSLSRARAALRSMQDEADLKRYDSARILAEEAITAAERAIYDGRDGALKSSQESFKDSAEIVNGLRSEIEATSRNVNGARYSEIDLDYDALDNGIRNAHNLTDKAEESYANGDYETALDTARIVRADLADINNTVVSAVPRSKS